MLIVRDNNDLWQVEINHPNDKNCTPEIIISKLLERKYSDNKKVFSTAIGYDGMILREEISIEYNSNLSDITVRAKLFNTIINNFAYYYEMSLRDDLARTKLDSYEYYKIYEKFYYLSQYDYDELNNSLKEERNKVDSLNKETKYFDTKIDEQLAKQRVLKRKINEINRGE